MNGRTTKLLRRFYATFYYKDPRTFQNSWKAIKKGWQQLSVPERKKAQKRMQRMLDRYDVAVKKAQKAHPNLEAIMEASTLLREKGLPTGEVPSAADAPAGWNPGGTPDDQNPGWDDPGGTE